MSRPPGIETSPYTQALARHLGINSQALRHQLTSGGLQGPYLDVERGLTVLEAKKQFAKKVATFRQRMATDERFRELMTGSPSAAALANNGKEKASKKKLKPGERTPQMEAQKIAAFKAQHMRKLMPRLAMHLVRLKLAKNYKRAYMKAVYILRQGKYPGPRWDDEPRCVEIFKEAGIDMTRFESASEVPLGNGQALIPAPTTAVTLRGNGVAEVVRTMAGGDEATMRRKLEALRRAGVALDQWEHDHF